MPGGLRWIESGQITTEIWAKIDMELGTARRYLHKSRGIIILIPVLLVGLACSTAQAPLPTYTLYPTYTAQAPLPTYTRYPTSTFVPTAVPSPTIEMRATIEAASRSVNTSVFTEAQVNEFVSTAITQCFFENREFFELGTSKYYETKFLGNREWLVDVALMAPEVDTTKPVHIGTWKFHEASGDISAFSADARTWDC